LDWTAALYPRKLRGSDTEVTYDPLDRWMSLSRYLREPRGAKSVEHLEVLRLSDTAAPIGRHWTARGPAAGWFKEEFMDSQSPTGLPRGHAPRHELAGDNDETLDETLEGLDEDELSPGDEEASGSTGSSSWQPLRPSGGRLPRILSNVVLDTMQDDDDDLFDLDAGEYPLASHRSGLSPRVLGHNTRSSSFDSDDLEAASLFSAALTVNERGERNLHVERASNDTIGSFLDDASDGTPSERSSLPATPRSPMRLPGERPWAPPRGTFKDIEMAARFSAAKGFEVKAKGFETDEIQSAAGSRPSAKAPGASAKARRTGQ